MDLVKFFSMNGGIGDTSYSSNSTLQRMGITMTKKIIDQAISDLCCSRTNFPKTLTMADLGCSSGPNTLLVASTLIDSVAKISLEMGHKSPEIQINLNDLPANDFNTIFVSLQEFQENLATHKSLPPFYFTGVPGSFYGRLFPVKTLHFVHSSYSLQWLSQIPLMEEINKGSIHLSSSTPESVSRAYYEQFEKDFLAFLSCRSEEMVAGGRMVLTITGRRSDNRRCEECYYLWGLFAMALNDMALEGLIDKEKLDSFNLPMYTPCPTEIKNVVEKECSFAISRLEILDVNWRAWKAKKYDNGESQFKENGISNDTLKEDYAKGRDVAMGIRAGIESLVVNHFGEKIIDEVFMRYEKILTNRMPSDDNEAIITVIVSLIRKG